MSSLLSANSRSIRHYHPRGTDRGCVILDTVISNYCGLLLYDTHRRDIDCNRISSEENAL